MRRVSVFLITLALIAGMVGCLADPVHDPGPEPDPDPDIRHELSISATIGGSVTSPGEGTFEYDAGTVVFLYAVPDECYRFVNWTGDTVANPASAVTTVTMDAAKSITANFVLSQYSLRVRSRVGGVVISPSEEESEHDCGTVVDLVAEAEDGYQFTYWTGSVGAVDDVNAASTTVTMMGDYSITANFAKEIRTWHDLDAIRDNLSGHYVLVNDLDFTTAGYEELAGPMANDGKGWQPIGSLIADPALIGIVNPVNPFTGSFHGQQYEINDLYVNRPDQNGVGLFGSVGARGVVQDVGVVNAEVTGHAYLSGLVGYNWGIMSDSYSSGSVTGVESVGGLAGWNHGTVNNSYSSASVGGSSHVGGLVGLNHATLSNSYSSGSVTGTERVGGLVGSNAWGSVSNSYSSGSVTGKRWVGGLLGRNWGSVSNCHYNYNEVRINGENVIAIGALFGEDFEEWLANDKSLDVNERLYEEDGYYLINNLSDFKQLLAFGQDEQLRFRLTDDLDLAGESSFYIPYLAGEFDGNGHVISNLTFDSDFAGQVGLFGYLASAGKVAQVGLEDADITSGVEIGGLVGFAAGTVIDSYSAGSVAGTYRVGGLVGVIHTGTVSNSYSMASVTGDWGVGGLLGWNYHHGTVSNSHYDYDEVRINEQSIITVGALFGEDFEQWLANDKVLDVNERLSQEDGYYLIHDFDDLKQLLAFGQDDSLKFRLKNDLDLGAHPNFYVPYLAGEFDGNGHEISNLSFGFDFITQVGLFGYLASGGKLSQVGVKDADIAGFGVVGGLVGYASLESTVSHSYSGGRVGGRAGHLGGLVGRNFGNVTNSYSTGSVTGHAAVGGLVGSNRRGVVRNSYSTASVSGHVHVGGLVGQNEVTVSNSYSTGSVTGDEAVGGLVGHNAGAVGNSFWDVQTSGMQQSDGGTGKTTAQMMNIATFKGSAWSIVAVAYGEKNPAYTWNIVDGQTYPFLNWQSVS